MLSSSMTTAIIFYKSKKSRLSLMIFCIIKYGSMNTTFNFALNTNCFEFLMPKQLECLGSEILIHFVYNFFLQIVHIIKFSVFVLSYQFLVSYAIKTTTKLFYSLILFSFALELLMLIFVETESKILIVRFLFLLLNKFFTNLFGLSFSQIRSGF